MTNKKTYLVPFPKPSMLVPLILGPRETSVTHAQGRKKIYWLIRRAGQLTFDKMEQRYYVDRHNKRQKILKKRTFYACTRLSNFFLQSKPRSHSARVLLIFQILNCYSGKIKLHCASNDRHRRCQIFFCTYAGFLVVSERKQWPI
jgi:hypothetical protein